VIPDRLILEQPFPCGVVPKRLLAEFRDEPDPAKREEIADSSTNGHAIDALVIFLRLLLSLGLDPQPDEPTGLYEVAFHTFGRLDRADYVVKGRLLDILYPAAPDQAAHEDVTLGELLQHPIVVSTVWAHPDMWFWRPNTWAKSTDGDWEPCTLDAEFLVRHAPIHVGPTADIGQYLSSKIGQCDLDGKTTLLLANNPRFIPVMMKGGRKLKELFGFALTTRLGSGHGEHPEENTTHYRLRAVLNLSKSHITMYRESGAPVVETVNVGDGSDDYQPKIHRGEHASNFIFDGSPELDFFLFYERALKMEGKEDCCPVTEYDPYAILYQYIPNAERDSEWFDCQTALFDKLLDEDGALDTIPAE
jgi:hypothetical protein